MPHDGVKEDHDVAKRRRHTPDQIIRKLVEGNKLLAGGAELEEVCRHLQIAESTWHRWVAQYGGMKASDAKRASPRSVEASSMRSGDARDTSEVRPRVS